MKLDVSFKDNTSRLTAEFGEVKDISDGGYDRGFNAGFKDGYDKGETDGYKNGETDGYNKGFDEGKKASPAAALAKSIIERTIVEIFPSDIDELGLTFVGWSSFERCTTLKRFISTQEQKINTNNTAFDGCTALLEAHISNMMGSSTFSGCSKLQKVVLFGNSQFNWGVFQNCTSLKVIDCRTATGVPSVGNASQFNGVPSGCQFVVPDNLYDAWSTATNWVAFDNLVFVKASDYTEYEVVE